MISSATSDAETTRELERHKNEGKPRDQVDREEKGREGDPVAPEAPKKRKAGRPAKRDTALDGPIATASRLGGLDAFEFLGRQHSELHSLFSDFSRTGTGCVRTRRILLDDLSEKLENHLRLKERLIVPLHRRVNDTTALQSLEEMSLIRALLRRITRLEVTDKSLGAKVKLLEQLVTHHIEAEVTSHIPRLRERQPYENFGHLAVRMEEEYRRLLGLHERRLRLREHRRWLAAREKNNRRFFGGYPSGRDDLFGAGF